MQKRVVTSWLLACYRSSSPCRMPRGFFCPELLHFVVCKGMTWSKGPHGILPRSWNAYSNPEGGLKSWWLPLHARSDRLHHVLNRSCASAEKNWKHPCVPCHSRPSPEWPDCRCQTSLRLLEPHHQAQAQLSLWVIFWSSKSVTLLYCYWRAASYSSRQRQMWCKSWRYCFVNLQHVCSWESCLKNWIIKKSCFAQSLSIT